MRLNIGHKIKDVQEKLDQISSERINFQLPETTRDLTFGGRETVSLVSVNVYGRDEDTKRIVDILVNSSKDDKRLSVLSIIGIGGLGKTTLAQMVFNDQKVDKHFDTKFWVCISEEFYINRVMRDIIGDKSESSVEELQKKVRARLNGKRYLIVLDDVWNEDENKWDMLRSVLDCESEGAFVIATTRKKKVAEIMKTNQHFELQPLSDDACWLLFKERAFRDERSKTPNLIDIGFEIAKKCKGVPLVIKTLAAQLGFKSDVKEWCRIRDSEMWKISQNEEYDILSILRLSYYDLPYVLRRCFAFCAIFPKDTKIEKEKLIQLWMTHDLIPTNENQELEDVGNKIWNELCWRSFFQDEKEEIRLYMKEFEKTCKMHDFMHDLAQYVMKDECYTMDYKSSDEDFRREICHVTIMINSFRKTLIGSLKKIGGLQSIIFHPHNYGTFSNEIVSILKKISSLRVLDVYLDVLSKDLSYMGCLKHLRFLNLSFSPITTLPNSICDLLYLQTLNLNMCFKLESLPKKIKHLINLRHLHLRDCNGLKYMPRGIRQLRHLKTLSMFVIGKESDCQFDELKELDIGGYMKIMNLESVSDASISRGGISMSQKSRINQLELHWNNTMLFRDDNQHNKIRDEKICEVLEVPTSRLKTLEMEGYKGENIPKWVGESSASLIQLHLWALNNVKHVFTMNNTNTSVGNNAMNEMVFMLFPLLQELTIKYMRNLRELVYPPIPIATTGAFPNLRKIEIYYCPKLGALPPHLKSLKDVTIGGECTDELLYSISNLSALTHLSFWNLGERSVLFGGGNKADGEAQRGPASTFQSLRSLNIRYCDKLSCLFDEGCEKLAREYCLTNLNSLTILDCPELMISLEQLRNLSFSIERLKIRNCFKLVPSKVEEANDLLRSLRVRLGSDKFNVDE